MVVSFMCAKLALKNATFNKGKYNPHFKVMDVARNWCREVSSSQGSELKQKKWMPNKRVQFFFLKLLLKRLPLAKFVYFEAFAVHYG